MMHMVIRAIVYARTRRGALAEARRVFDRLTDGSSPFDGYTTFDQNGKGHAGRDRWGNLPAVARADTEESKRLIDAGWERTEAVAMEALNFLRNALRRQTTAELLAGWDADLDTGGAVRDACVRLGEAVGSAHWLYDHDGEAIHTRAHLSHALAQWRSLIEGEEEEPYRGLSVWVVPADVHF